MENKISLSEKFGDNIFTRKTISSFFKFLNKSKNDEVTLDFSGVNFISRSCADEYLKQKEKTKKKIIEANMSEDVCKMFSVVKKQYENAGYTISFNICNSENNLISV